MPKHYIENTTTADMVVAGYLISPGTGREIDMPEGFTAPEGSEPQPARQDEPELEEAQRPELPERLQALQLLSIAKIKPELETLTADELRLLAQAEEASPQPRSSLLDLIAAQLLKLASGTQGEPT